jgi:hypothetical protein
MRLTLIAFCTSLVAVGGCTEPNPFWAGTVRSDGPSDTTFYWDQGGGDARRRDTGPGNDLPRLDKSFPQKPQGVDVLIVVDNSGGMDYAQQWLAVDIDTLITGLEGLPGGANYRIGVTTTDIGVGGFQNAGCTTSGDDGKLIVPGPCSSHGFSANFVEKVKGNKNVVSGVDAAVSCMIKSVGTQGCGFEQPLEAMRRALIGSNPGFLRSSAALAVILLTNEDDCSAASNALFDYQDTALGAYKSYRCFQHGILCGGKKPPCASTVLGQCKPGQQWLHDVKKRYASFLQGLKPAGWVSSLVIAGPIPATVEVTKSGTGCAVVPSCSAGSYQKGDPGIRLQELVKLLGGHAGAVSICASSYRPGLDSLMQRIQSSL